MAERPPFDPAPWAMLLLGVLVVTGAATAMLASLHCLVLAPADGACSNGWGQRLGDWLNAAMPVLIALIVTRKREP